MIKKLQIPHNISHLNTTGYYEILPSGQIGESQSHKGYKHAMSMKSFLYLTYSNFAKKIGFFS